MEPVRYPLQVVTFLDILGFGSIIESEGPTTILKYYATLHETASFSGLGTKELGLRFFSFSDTCIRTIPVINVEGRPNTYGILFHELSDIVSIQCRMIWNHAVMVRGAVTMDEEGGRC